MILQIHSFFIELMDGEKLNFEKKCGDFIDFRRVDEKKTKKKINDIV